MFPLLTLLPLLALVAASPIAKRANNQLIVSSRNGQCLSPLGGAAAASSGSITDGTPLVSMDCAQAAGWDISPGSGSVILSGTGYAMDAGTKPKNNGGLKIWTSYPGLSQQTWYLTTDGRIAITGGTQCLDEGANGPQTYTCTPDNDNQAWTIKDKTPTPPPATGVLPNVPKGAVYGDPARAGAGRRIHPYGRNDLCLTIQGGQATSGTLVQVTYCFPNDSTNAQYQLWDTVQGLSGPVKLHSNQNLCLDAGASPSNNGVVKVWTCGGYPQQNWLQGGDQGIWQTSGNQCLDVQLGSGPSEQANYPNQGVLQTYQCYPGSQQQNFHLLN